MIDLTPYCGTPQDLVGTVTFKHKKSLLEYKNKMYVQLPKTSAR